MIPVPALMALNWARNNKGQAIIGAVAVAFLAAAGVQSVRLGWAHSTIDRMKKEAAAMAGKYEAARADASEKARLIGVQYRSQESRWQAEKEKADEQYRRNLKAAEARAAALARDNQQLRTIAEGYARGPASPADDSVEACRVRAATLGQLFSEADRAAGEMAQAADRHADEVRLCLSAWPQ